MQTLLPNCVLYVSVCGKEFEIYATVAFKNHKVKKQQQQRQHQTTLTRKRIFDEPLIFPCIFNDGSSSKYSTCMYFHFFSEHNSNSCTQFLINRLALVRSLSSSSVARHWVSLLKFEYFADVVSFFFARRSRLVYIYFSRHNSRFRWCIKCSRID